MSSIKTVSLTPEQEQELQLRMAFYMVSNPADWKDRINKVVDLDTTVRSVAEWLALIDRAVIHYTGTPTSVKKLGGNRVRVKALGYRCGPAGDH